MPLEDVVPYPRDSVVAKSLSYLTAPPVLQVKHPLSSLVNSVLYVAISLFLLIKKFVSIGG